MESSTSTTRQRPGTSGDRIPAIVRSADLPDPEQMRILARLAPEAKLAVARRLWEDAIALEAAWLRERHPEEGDDAILRRLRAWQLHGRARLD